jgi:hypothetical protein
MRFRKIGKSIFPTQFLLQIFGDLLAVEAAVFDENFIRP